MSRLHSQQMSACDVAAHTDALDVPGMVMPAQVTEGSPGVVIFELAGRRVMREMRWGFPRVFQGIDEAGIIGLVADLTNPMWDGTVADPRYRCIIPISHFGNPDGEPGKKTRTWFSLKGEPMMLWAGFCRNIPGTGPVYAGMTMEANIAIPPTNDRMPALIERTEIDRWLHGSIQDVIGFQFRPPFKADRFEVMRTDDRWRSGSPPPSAIQPALL